MLNKPNECGKQQLSETESIEETIDFPNIELVNFCYQQDGETLFYASDKEGNTIYYYEDGKTVSSIHFSDGSWCNYRRDGKTLFSVSDKDGKITDFCEDGKMVIAVSFSKEYSQKCNLNGKNLDIKVMFYRKDGKTLHCVHLADGRRHYYKEDGKNLDYSIYSDGSWHYYSEDENITCDVIE